MSRRTHRYRGNGTFLGGDGTWGVGYHLFWVEWGIQEAGTGRKPRRNVLGAVLAHTPEGAIKAAEEWAGAAASLSHHLGFPKGKGRAFRTAPSIRPDQFLQAREGRIDGEALIITDPEVYMAVATYFGDLLSRYDITDSTIWDAGYLGRT